MNILSHTEIQALQITPRQAMAWVREAFSLKQNAFLPAKTSIAFEPGKFMNSMPSVLPDLGVMGIKIVHRYPKRTPSIGGQILLYDLENGRLLALMDAFWITTARTGAVAAITIEALAKKDFQTVAMLGLGNTAKATLVCLAETFRQRSLEVKLLRYKDHCEKFMEYFRSFDNLTFSCYDAMQPLVRGSDVVISCITNAENCLAEPEWFGAGTLLIPVHTKGFQNCDAVFDKVFGDDIHHVEKFKFFSSFRSFAELQDVLSGENPGRTSPQERILGYNPGISIHDVVFAKHIYDAARGNVKNIPDLDFGETTFQFCSDRVDEGL